MSVLIIIARCKIFHNHYNTSKSQSKNSDMEQLFILYSWSLGNTEARESMTAHSYLFIQLIFFLFFSFFDKYGSTCVNDSSLLHWQSFITFSRITGSVNNLGITQMLWRLYVFISLARSYIHFYFFIYLYISHFSTFIYLFILFLFLKIYLYINSFLYIYLFILFLGFHGPIILPFLLLPTTIFACPFNQDPQFLTVH